MGGRRGEFDTRTTRKYAKVISYEDEINGLTVIRNKTIYYKRKPKKKQ